MPNSEFQPASIDDELVAYLDGELDEAEVLRVEERLSHDSKYRERLRQLEQTWDMLDALPAAQPNQSFTQSTLELVLSDAEMAVAARRKGNRLVVRALLLAVLPLSLAVISFGMSQHFANARYRQLMRDLPLIENFDVYEATGQIAFLEGLEREGLFLGDLEVHDDAATQQVVNDYSISQNEQRLKSMDTGQLGDLSRKRKRFDELNDVQKAELRDFHEALVEHPNRELLARIMFRYFDWLKLLNLFDEARLRDMPMDARIGEIVRMRAEQSRQYSYLPVADFESFELWMRQIAQEKAAQIQDSARYLRRSRGNDGDPEPLQILRRLILSGDAHRVLKTEDYEQLKQMVSDVTKELLQDRDSTARLLLYFVRNPYASEEELQAFYSDVVPSDLRHQLDALPPNSMKEELRRLYTMHRFGLSPDRWNIRRFGDRRD